MSLYDIDKRLLEALESADTCDENGEFVSADIDSIMLDRETKLENIGLYIKNLKSLSDSIKIEEKALAERRNSYDKKIDWLIAYALNSVLVFGGLETAKVKLGARKSEVVEIINQDNLDKGLINVKVTETPNKIKIKELLKSGQRVPGAELRTNYTLQVK